MKKKIYIISIISISLLTIILFLYNNKANSKKINIEINNKTDSVINSLKLSYEGIQKDINIPEIKPSQHINLKITPNEKFCENHIELKYHDKKKYENKITLLGYFEKNNDGTLNPKVDIKVRITKIDSEGKLSVDIKN